MRYCIAVIGLLAAVPIGAVTGLHMTDNTPTVRERSVEQGKPFLGELRVRGSGRDTILLLPCGSCRWRSFDTFADRNAPRYTMVAVTLPGYGGTALPPLPLDAAEPVWQDYALAALSHAADSLRLRNVVVAGHSYGAIFAMRFAALRPDIVRGLISIDGAIGNPYGRFQNDRSARLSSADSVARAWRARFRDLDLWHSFNRPAITDRDRSELYFGMFMSTPPEVVIQYWREMYLVNLDSIARTIAVPFLDVTAIRPRIATQDSAIRAHELRLDSLGVTPSRVLYLRCTPHFMMEEAPDLLDGVIDAFVNAVRDGDRQLRSSAFTLLTDRAKSRCDARPAAM